MTTHKKRKIQEIIEKKCDICYYEKPILDCFHTCTIKVCKECMIKQLEIKKIQRLYIKYQIKYKCPYCRKIVKYFPLENSSSKLENDTKFSNWIRGTPDALVSIVDELISKKNNEVQNYNYSIFEEQQLLPLLPPENIIQSSNFPINNYNPLYEREEETEEDEEEETEEDEDEEEEQ